MKFRCYVCPAKAGSHSDSGLEFDVRDRTKPVCPSCGSTEASGALHALVEIHFEPPLKPELRGRKGAGYIACDPSKSAGTAFSTGNTSAVNCVACMRSDIWYEEAHATGLKAGGKDVGYQDKFFYRTKPDVVTEAKAEPTAEPIPAVHPDNKPSDAPPAGHDWIADPSPLKAPAGELTDVRATV